MLLKRQFNRHIIENLLQVYSQRILNNKNVGTNLGWKSKTFISADLQEWDNRQSS